MENFPIIQALCRAAVASPNDAVRRQIERLRDQLKDDGETRQAASLARVLSAAEKAAELSPSKITRSRSPSSLGGEELRPDTKMPVDRETATQLADLVLSEDLSDDPPIFEAHLSGAINGLIEEWAHTSDLERLGVEPAKTCLIYGPPGTGKTRLALWMASQLGLPIVLARLDGIVSSFLGTTSRNIGTLFGFAARYKCVLLLDEFDAIAKLRDDPQEVGEIKRVVNTLLQNLDARKSLGLTIGVTNHENLLDPAIWRRFEAHLELPLPKFDVRLNIAKEYLPPLNLSDAQTKLLAWYTEGATGSEIETLIRGIKRSTAISNGEEVKFIDTLRNFALISGGRIDPIRKDLLSKSQAEIVSSLLDAPNLGFNQSDVADVFGVQRGTVSKWLKADGERK